MSRHKRGTDQNNTVQEIPAMVTRAAQLTLHTSPDNIVAVSGGYRIALQQ
jgi:hypothetical protein